ncbi:MAG TPA: phosphoribosylamine--glycine ligase [Candidatus Polarisedimenticolia bacterium]|nr:phosphoribosylamine--glycine ligase [Candidatus Polarisedimenticolia bacterium]
MNILVVGGGAREHALAWAVRRGGRDRAVLCVPGNAGIASVAECIPGDPTAVATLADLARSRRVDLTIVGPEAALAAGLSDELERRGMKVFGASRAAAEIETSKIFSKEFMLRHRIPTAAFDVADSAAAAARILARRGDRPSVVKADGLAAGKGVVVAATRREAEEAVAAMLVERRFGAAGDRILIEDRLTGPEVSFFALCDGERARPLTTCQDYKRLEDGDRGPNTGGMGGYSPSVLVDAALERSLMERVVLPTVRGLAAEGRPYRGVLYAGLMLTPEGPQVLEYNARFGDPEAELIAVRLASDLVEVIEATLAGRLDEAPLRFHAGGAVCVVLAAAGYPGTPRAGDAITGLESDSRPPGGGDDVVVFHAATRAREGRIETAGGRVLTVTARAGDLAEARRRAYAAVAAIRFPGMQHRRDIAAFATAGTSPAPGN